MNDKSSIKVKKIIIILLIFICLILIADIIKTLRKTYKNKENHLRITPFTDLFTIPIEKNTILIFEPNNYHYECLPGYSHYFILLGYNVDVLMHLAGIDTFCLFHEIKKVRLLTFISRSEIEKNAKNLSIIINKYDFVLLQTTDKENKMLYTKLGLRNMSRLNFCIS